VGTFAWNSDRHLELYYAVPCFGRVLHTANVRLHPDEVVYVVTHAADEVLFVDASLTLTRSDRLVGYGSARASSGCAL
jgi:fatty-acyl-CoA synthase